VNMLKSIGVVVGSYMLSIVLVLATDPLLSMLFPGDFVRGRIPSNKALIASTVLFVVVSIVCAWLCARFAPSSAARHVLWFFVLGEVLGLATMIPTWNNGWPHWYPLSWLVTWPVSCWLGFLLGGRSGVKASGAPAVQGM
jgi:hypothetical protein